LGGKGKNRGKIRGLPIENREESDRRTQAINVRSTCAEKNNDESP